MLRIVNQSLFVALPEGERFVIELLRNAHVKIMFYLALLRRVCLSRSSASVLSAPFVGGVNAALLHKTAPRCLDSSLLGPCGNRRAALISLRSGPAVPSRATGYVDSGLLLSDVVS